jgi:hypothetical protein
VVVCLCVSSVAWAGPEASPASDSWTGSLTAYWYLLPDDENFVLPIAIAERGPVHLEARYNYEDRDTASLFGGWIFEGGDAVEWSVTPMLGAVVGETDGIAPALTWELSWKQLALYSENEYVFDLGDSRGSFFYDWSELTWEPLDWLGAGMVTQRTRVYQVERELQRGLMVRFTMGRWNAGAYWFNPGARDDFGIVSAGMEF